MNEADAFIFLRPFWLLTLLLVPLLFLRPESGRGGEHGWAGVIPPALLGPLIRKPDGGKPFRSGSRSGTGLHLHPALLPALVLTVSSLALAGPSWRTLPSPLQQQDDALVIVLDLSLSMLATDSSPDRLTLAKRKVHDVLQVREGRFTGLVVYAGDAHVVAPLTDDRRTIEGLLAALDPLIMPVAGNRADLAVTRAAELLGHGTAGPGHILLITDGIPEAFAADLQAALAASRLPLTLSGILAGTTEGGPVPLPNHGFIREGDQILVDRMSPEPLRTLARSTGGDAVLLTPGDADLSALGLHGDETGSWQEDRHSQTSSQRVDDGYWLLWALLPLLWLTRRRSAPLLVLGLLVTGAGLPGPAQAATWADLWQKPEQQARELIGTDPADAARRFSDPDWTASAHFRNGQPQQALSLWDQALAESEKRQADPRTLARIHYNRGNALAHGEQPEEAIAAWDKALQLDPGLSDARHNRDLVQDFLDRQQAEADSRDPSESAEEPSSGQDQDEQSAASQDQGQAGEAEDTGDDPTGGEPGTDPEEAFADEPQPADPDEDQNQQTDQESGQGAETESALNQSQEQWLRRIPDDPSGLLRRKFLQQSRQRNTETSEKDTPW